MTSTPLIFDRKRVRLHRQRAVRMGGENFLLEEMAVRAKERLDEINHNFPVVLELGPHSGSIAQEGGVFKFAGDEEFLPIAENSIDLCISLGSLHWVNDLPGALIQINRALKPGGLFLAMLPGGQTLKELRQSFEQAEMEFSGGISPRVSPFIDVRDAGGLLQRAGFSHPVVDSEILTLEYDHPLKLLKELRAMGEANALIHSRKSFTPCSLVMLMADYYMRHFSSGERMQATVELVTLTAWKG